MEINKTEFAENDKQQVNAQLTGPILDAFLRYRDDIGIPRNSVAAYMLIAKSLEQLGYLKKQRELSAA